MPYGRLYIPLRSDKSAFHISVAICSRYFISHYVQIKDRSQHRQRFAVQLYIPLRSDKREQRLHRWRKKMVLYIPLRSDKRLIASTQNDLKNSFISHYVQIKVSESKRGIHYFNLYIPLRSDKSPCRQCLPASALFFISHYVQIKAGPAIMVKPAAICFISHYVQIKEVLLIPAGGYFLTLYPTTFR